MIRTLVAAAIVLHLSSLYAIDNFSATFVKAEWRTGAVDSTAGLIYYAGADSVVMLVSSPINQWMILDNDTLSIYYPDGDQVLKLPSSPVLVAFPILQLVVNAVKEDLGLGASRYSLASSDVKEDTLTVVWLPPVETGTALGRIAVKYVNDTLDNVLMYDPDDQLRQRSHFSYHVSMGGYLLPCKIEVTEYAGVDSLLESIELFEVEVNRGVPDTVRACQIPATANARVIE